MIKGKVKEDLTLENILKKVSEYDIYRFFAGDFKINVPFSSPIPGRRDKNPSFVIGTKYGNMHHIDFGDPNIRGSVVDFVMQMTGIPNFGEALKKIDKEMKLGFSNGEIADYQSIINKYQAPKIITKPPTKINVSVRNFNKEELAYWRQYHLGLEDLKAGSIYAIKKISLNGKLIPLKTSVLRFGYLLGDKWKIYSPYEEKERKWWPNNIPNNAIEGLYDIQHSQKAIITKSRKDRLVLRKILPTVASVQNESLIAFSPDSIDYIQDACEEVYLAYDIDEPGKKASHLVTKTFGFKHVNVPDKYLQEGIKDFADLAKVHGLQAIEDHLKLKGIT